MIIASQSLSIICFKTRFLFAGVKLFGSITMTSAAG